MPRKPKTPRESGVGGGKTPRKDEYGLRRSAYPKNIQWRIDQDYLERLSPSERAWLNQFLSEYHAASFGEAPLHHSVKLRRDVYRAKNYANADAYEIAKVSGMVVMGADESLLERLGGLMGDDLAPPSPDAPAYLNSEAYKAAKAEFRRHLPKQPRNRVKEGPSYRRARNKLRKVVQSGTILETEAPDSSDPEPDGSGER